MDKSWQGLAGWRGELFVKAVRQRSVSICCCFIAKKDQLSPPLAD